MADLDMYTWADPQSELLNRPDKTYFVTGQAGFFAIALQTGVPILNRLYTAKIDGGVSDLGSGLSFAVEKSYRNLIGSPATSFVNEVYPTFRAAKDPRKVLDLFSNAVFKRISPGSRRRGSRPDDACALAAITNELRILANASLRESRNIVRLTGLLWHEVEVQQRFWPQLVLESATKGNLPQYLRSSNRLHDRAKFHIMDQISLGLGYIHAHGIVHCDIKPMNVLVFDNPALEGLAWLGIQPITIKICDFGCAIILSDYQETREFQARIGTRSWMAPEMDLGKPIAIGLLSMVDVYSFGLVSASIVLNRGERFSDDAIRQLKLAQPSDQNPSFTSILMRDVETPCSSGHLLRSTLDQLLFECLRPKSEERSSIATVHYSLRKNFISSTLDNGLDVNVVSHLFDDVFTPFPVVEPHQTVENPVRMETIITPSKFPQVCSITSARGSDRTGVKHFLPVPDLAFEREFRSSRLQAVASKEVIDDLKRQVRENRDQTGRLAFELAGAAFNGTMLEDHALGRAYLCDAIQKGCKKAVIYAHNIFDAVGESIPHDVAQTASEELKKHGADWTIVSKLFKTEILQRGGTPDDISLGMRVWTRLCRDDYEMTLNSETVRECMSLAWVIFLLKFSSAPSVASSKPHFDSRKLSYDMLSHEKITKSQIPILIQELRKHADIDMPSEHGFTLVQSAVINRDKELLLLLFNDLDASPNKFGNTPKMTPLWLACCLGYHELVLLLRRRGSDPLCHDELSGRGILHFLHRFSEPSQIEEIGKWALQAGADINSRTPEGVSPLLAALIEFDHSNGAAVRFLLRHGADPTLAAPDGPGIVCPIGLCVSTLDYELLKLMLSVAPQDRISDAKAQAFLRLALHTKFHMMCQAGLNFKAKLQETLKLIIDPGMVNALRQSRFVDDIATPLSLAAHGGRGYLVDAILNLNQTTIPELPTLLLRLAIESRNKPTIEALLSRRVNILEQLPCNEDLKGGNPLHYAAGFFPEVIPRMVQVLEKTLADRQDRRTVKDILDTPNKDGYSVFALLLGEGSLAEQNVADLLRRTYRIDHDPIIGSAYLTLTGVLITLSVFTGNVDPSRIEYLLSLSPKPRFLPPTGSILSLLAVAVWRPFQNVSADRRSAQLTRLVLKHFPDYEYLNQRVNGSYGAIHAAAACANTTALHILKQHGEAMHPGRELPYNEVQMEGTVLDHLVQSVKTGVRIQRRIFSGKTLEDQHDSTRERSTDTDDLDPGLEWHHQQVADCFKELREDGALVAAELRGVRIGHRMLPTALMSRAHAVHFLDRVTRQFSLGAWAFDEEPIALHSDNSDDGSPSLINGIVRFYCVELVWMHNYFSLRGSELHFSALKDQYEKEAITYFAERSRWNGRYGVGRDGVPEAGKRPFESKNYTVKLNLQQKTVNWTRPGREWTTDEVEILKREVLAEWDNEFRERVFEFIRMISTEDDVLRFDGENEQM